MARKLADVAKQAGVSEATVSRVLNGKPGVSEPTRAAVLTALDVLGYERPTQLRASARGSSGSSARAAEPDLPGLAEVVAGALAQRGLQRGPVHPNGPACPRPPTSRCCSSSRSPG